MLFSSLKLIQPILDALNDQGYSNPTPIQQQAIPHLLEGRDLQGCAQTGTGKTAAFAIPILQLLAKPKHYAGQPKPIRALIVTPTRELAIQIQENLDAYGKYLQVRNTVIFGGVNQHPQVQALQRGVDILVATPGRLLDLISQRYITLKDIEILVLDEADRMLDMGFIHDVKKIIAQVPSKRQTLLFSATMPKEIQSLASGILTNPEFVEVTPVSSTVEKIDQSLFFVEKTQKKSLLSHLLTDTTIETALVFTRTKHGADKIVKGLVREGIRAEAIHGNKSQAARQKALTNFKNRTIRILVATDIAARGIDVDDMSHVINFDLPDVPETYVHRIGRTGRAGAEGIAYSFCDREETVELRDIQRLIGKKIPVKHDHPFHVDIDSVSNVQLSKPASKPAMPAQRPVARKHYRPQRSRVEF